MKCKQEVIEQIERAFGANPYPGDNFLQGSYEACEAYEEIQVFIGKTDRRKLDSELLDGHYFALTFSLKPVSAFSAKLAQRGEDPKD